MATRQETNEARPSLALPKALRDGVRQFLDECYLPAPVAPKAGAMDRLSLLAVFAHPDDESCGPGATLALYAHRGVEVTLVCVTKGERGAWGADQTTPLGQFGARRIQELACACESLGIRRWAVLGYPDGDVSRCQHRDLERELVKWIRKVRPRVVVTHCPEGPQGHADHHALSRVVARAYLGAGHPHRFPEHIAQGLAPWQPVKLYYALPPDLDVATKGKDQQHFTRVDATDFVDAKIRALHCHASQQKCWRGLLERLLSSPRWTESFYLAHSRLAHAVGAEDDLFHGMVSDALPTGRTMRRGQPWR